MQFFDKLLGRKSKSVESKADAKKKLDQAETDRKINHDIKQAIAHKPLYTIQSAYEAINNLKSTLKHKDHLSLEDLERYSYRIYYILNHSKELKDVATIFLVTIDADNDEDDQFSKVLNKPQESRLDAIRSNLLSNINTILSSIKHRVSQQITYQLSDRVMLTQQSASDLDLKSSDMKNIHMMTESLSGYGTLNEALKHLKCEAVQQGDNAIISVHIDQKRHNTAYDNGIVGVIYADAIQIKNKPIVPSKYNSDYLHNLDLLNKLEKD